MDNTAGKREPWEGLQPAHLEHAREFLDAAAKLEDEPGAIASTCNRPKLYLLAHGLELTFKCMLRWQKEKHFGHDLANLLEAIRRNDALATLLTNADHTIRLNWMERLTDERNRYSQNTYGVGRVPTDTELKTAAADLTLQRASEWLSPLQTGKLASQGDEQRRSPFPGGVLRYQDASLYLKIPQLQSGGAVYDPTGFSIRWGCDAILTQLEEELRRAK